MASEPAPVAEPIARGKAPTADTIRADAAAWCTSPALIEMLGAFGGPEPPAADPTNLVDVLRWSEVHWDFRQGRERNLVDPDQLTADLEKRIAGAARDLGMVDPMPPLFDEYDHVVMLGGLARACWWRPEFAAWMLAGGVRAGQVSAITAFRPLNEQEVPLLEVFGLQGATSELEAFALAVKLTHQTASMRVEIDRQEADHPHSREYVARGERPDGIPVVFVAAPTTDPRRRANTADGYAYWAENVTSLRQGQRVLLVTSQIYVPFQHADAVRMLGLPYGCVVDTVGIDHRYVSARGIGQSFTGVNYLQEIHSALRSTKALLDALEGR